MSKYTVLKERLTLSDIKKIMAYFGVEKYIDREEYTIFPTICHNANEKEASLKLYYYKENKIFHCYTECSESFNIFGLVKRAKEVRGASTDELEWNEIYNLVTRICDIEEDFMYEIAYAPRAGRYKKKNRNIILPIISEGLLNVFTQYYPIEWINDNITKQSMDVFGILFSQSRNCIIIPHRNHLGELIGIRGRYLNPEDIEYGKYRPVKIEGKMYSHPLSLALYGFYENEANLKRKKIAFIFEAEKSVLQCEGYFGREENVALSLCGKNFNKIHLNLLKKAGVQEIVLCFDNQEGSFEIMKKIQKKYSKYIEISFVYDFGDSLDDKDSPSDKGKEILLNLLNKRIKLQGDKY